jgi:hypothetical protein
MRAEETTTSSVIVATEKGMRAEETTTSSVIVATEKGMRAEETTSGGRGCVNQVGGESKIFNQNQLGDAIDSNLILLLRQKL